MDRSRRFRSLDQKGVTLWMTGLSGSGKSTIAQALEDDLVYKMGKHVYRIDGDNIRSGLSRDLGFSAEDRAESVRRASEVAALFADSGTITIVSLVSPYRADRDLARELHEKKGIPFLEVFMNVPLSVVEERDPKGLYKKVKSGEIKGFTGVDAPYEAPLSPEVDLPNYEMTVDECVDALKRKLYEVGVLSGGTAPAPGLAIPDGGSVIDLHVAPSLRAARVAEADTLPNVLLTDIDLNWLQVIGEGWAAPLRGFMREGALLQTLHFNSLLVDPDNFTGNALTNERQTDFTHFGAAPRERVSMPIPIVLPATDFTADAARGAKAVTLRTKNGEAVAILRNPEVYAYRKEELVARCFGFYDPAHPYVAHITSSGDWLIGGEIELLDRIRYNDGLDEYRFTAKEMVEKFRAAGADAVFAFQTRNPTHAGHAYLMRTGRENLLKEGFKNPVLWLSPLGGWTKEGDVPLDVRVRQHEAVLANGMLDPATTILAIWPSPMIYAGPTEVQFHAKSRRDAGARYFVVGRDPAGMARSSGPGEGDDLYNGDHGRYVLENSPGMGEMDLLSFDKVYYDKRDHSMRTADPARPDDFISISGTKMRALAAQGAKPCPNDIPSDLLAANCIPPGFMVPEGWAIVCDYYQNLDSPDWVPWSRQVFSPSLPDNVVATGGAFGTTSFAVNFHNKAGVAISPWHDIPLENTHDRSFNMVVEIPMHATAKMEVQKEVAGNPIMQDTNGDGSARYYTYGTPFFNYGLLPQTWEDPGVSTNGYGGDNDPLDVMEVGGRPLPMGSVTRVKVLGSLELIDEGETDHKIIVLSLDDPDASRIDNMEQLENVKPGMTAALVRWLKYYKTSDGKAVNNLSQETPTSKEEALHIVSETHTRWLALTTGQVSGTGFALP